LYVEEQATPKSVLDLVRRVITSELEIPADDFDDSASLRRQYELDSVAAINILFALEQALDIEIDTAAIARVDSALQIRDFLLSLLKH
jgi:acyl carrier protein